MDKDNYNQIAEKCCGSCDEYYPYSKWRGFQYCTYRNGRDGKEQFAYEKPCGKYSPRNPIDNPVSTRWNILKKCISIMIDLVPDARASKVLEKMSQLEKENE